MSLIFIEPHASGTSEAVDWQSSFSLSPIDPKLRLGSVGSVVLQASCTPVNQYCSDCYLRHSALQDPVRKGYEYVEY